MISNDDDVHTYSSSILLTLGFELKVHDDCVPQDLNEPCDVAIEREVSQLLLLRAAQLALQAVAVLVDNDGVVVCFKQFKQHLEVDVRAVVIFHFDYVKCCSGFCCIIKDTRLEYCTEI